jgi:lambda family phage minor tail protein L
MSTNEKIKQDSQKLNVGSPVVTLIRLDATNLGGSIYYFTPMTNDGDKVEMNGVEYTPLPLEISGLEISSQGSMPRPQISISNVNKALLAEIISYNDLLGAEVRITRTFKKFLDGESAADPNAVFPADIFYIERKVSMNKFSVVFELICALDAQDLYIPRRQALAYCQHRYGIGASGTTCPYDGGEGYFDENGEITNEAGDKCGKQVYDCQLRFGTYGELPMWAFPSVGRFGYPWRR